MTDAPAPNGPLSAASLSEAVRDDGFRSDRSRRRMVRLSWLLGVVSFVLQLGLPVVLVVTAVIVMLGEALSMPSAHVPGATLHRGRVVFAVPLLDGSDSAPDGETPAPVPRRRWRLLSVPADDSDDSSSEPPRTEAELQLATSRLDGPRLASAGGELWVMTRGGAGVVEGGTVRWRDARAPLPRMRTPFAHRGQLAVPQLDGPTSPDEPAKLVVHTWSHGRWATAGTFDLDLPDEDAAATDLQVIDSPRGLEVFVATGDDELIHRTLAADEKGADSPWSQTLPTGSDWCASLTDGQPAIFRLMERLASPSLSADETVVPHLLKAHRDGEGWLEDLDLALERGREIHALADADGSTWLVTDGRYGGVDVHHVRATKLITSRSHPGPFPFVRSVMLLVLSQTAPLLLTLLVAFLLARAMRYHRHPAYRLGSTALPYASLLRRGIAEGVDLVAYLTGPAALLGPQIVRAPETISNGLVLFVCVLWCLPVMFVLSFMEGHYGWTPGKWLAGIRVVGLDLRPCGLRRALIRNLLLMVDGILHYLVGILVIATSRHWQRLGDRAARTIVVRTRDAPPRDGSRSIN